MALSDPAAGNRRDSGAIRGSTGEEIHRELLAMLASGGIRPVVGRRESALHLPSELERMERRETMGRTILDWTGELEA